MAKNDSKWIVEESENRILYSIPIKIFINEFIYRIDLDADYQREKIWKVSDRRCLIDSIVKDIDIPKLYLVEIKNNKQFDFECVDGKQRMWTLMNFLKPDDKEEKPLTYNGLGKSYTYKKLKEEHPTIAKKIEESKLHVIVFKYLPEELVREIFRRLQLGERLNSGELLKSRTGTIRDFIFKEIGKHGPFLRKTKVSEKRFSREFTLAQICINSFNKIKTKEFTRARYDDLVDFFEDNYKLDRRDENLERIRKVLNLMDKSFNEKAEIISSRAVAVSAYLFCEELFNNKETDKISKFAKFFEELLNEIKLNMEQIRKYEIPSNTEVLDKFQKNILQASVEANSILRRHNFLKIAFNHYLKTKGRIIGGK